MATKSEILSIVAQVSDLLENTPGASRVLDLVRTGKVEPEEAIMALTDLAIQAGHGEALLRASGKIESLTTTMVNPTNNLPMMNPVFEAAIAERAHLDGDVPEYRTGRIPDEGHPAVPVITDALDPVVVGMQLEHASNEVAAEIQKALEDHNQRCERLLAKVDADFPEEERETRLEITKKSLPPAPIGVKGYEAGRKPVARVGIKVNPIDTATLSPEKRRHYIYQSLATTQGRSSLTPVIQDGIVSYLKAHSINAKAGEPAPEGAVTTNWVTTLWGAEDISEDFNPILTAIHSMCRDLMDFAINHPVFFVRVTPYHGIADRKFGWVVVAGSKEK